MAQLSKVLKVVCWARVPGEIKRSRDLRGGRWSWTLWVEEIMGREVELG